MILLYVSLGLHVLGLSAIVMATVALVKLKRLGSMIESTGKLDISELPSEPLVKFSYYSTCAKCGCLRMHNVIMTQDDYSATSRDKFIAQHRKSNQTCDECVVAKK